MKLYPASCKEDSKFSFCTGSKNRRKTDARKQFGCFRKSFLLYLLATHLLPPGPPLAQMFFLLFLQDEIRLIEWITKRTSSTNSVTKPLWPQCLWWGLHSVSHVPFYAILLWIYIFLCLIGEMRSQIGIHSKDPASVSEEALGLIRGNFSPQRLQGMRK